MLKKLLIPILSIFMLCCFANFAMAQENPYPDTSQIKGCEINLTDLYDKSKYTAVGAVPMPPHQIVSYHISKEDIFPKYVSILWFGKECIGLTYYDNGIFRTWVKNYRTKQWNQVSIVKRIQEAFKMDFEHIFPNVKFPLSTSC